MLLPDAELAEDAIEEVVRRDRPGELAERGERRAEVHRRELEPRRLLRAEEGPRRLEALPRPRHEPRLPLRLDEVRGELRALEAARDGSREGGEAIARERAHPRIHGGPSAGDSVALVAH